MTENTAASAPGPSAGSADWKAYALRVQRENEELLQNNERLKHINRDLCHDHNTLLADGAKWQSKAEAAESELAAIKVDIAAAGKELPVENRREYQCGVHFTHPAHDYCNGSAAQIIMDEELISRGYVDSLRQSAAAIIAAREATIRELEAKCAGMKEDAERWKALPAFLEDYQINYVNLLCDIDKYTADTARAADGGVK